MKFPFIDLPAQYRAYQSEIDAAISSVMTSCHFIMGSELSSFEEELKEYVGCRHAIGCASGTSALELCLRASGIGPGDEVIVPPFTFFASAEMVSLVGATPVFVDIERESFNIDPSQIEAAITDKTKAIMPVSLYGQVCNLESINAIAQKHNLIVIEDAAQSFGGSVGGKKSGSFTPLAATSFFPAKPLGGIGDGGAVFCSDDETATVIRQLLNHGQDKRYSHARIGVNGRLDAIQAAVLRIKLKHFDEELQKRQKIAAKYDALLKDSVMIPKINPDHISAYAQYTIRVQNREQVIEKLTADGIPTAVHYPIPLYAQAAYAHMNIDPSQFPETEKAAQEVLSLPFSPFLQDEHLEMTAEAVKKAVS